MQSFFFFLKRFDQQTTSLSSPEPVCKLQAMDACRTGSHTCYRYTILNSFCMGKDRTMLL